MYRTVSAKAARLPVGRFSKGVAMFTQGYSFSSTVKLYHRWWKAWGTLPVGTWVRAAANYRAGRFQVAVNEYRIGLNEAPHHPAAMSARLDLAYCLFKAGDLETAARELKFVISQSPVSREGYLRLANIQMWLGQKVEAAWTMRRAMRNVPRDAELVGTFLLALIENSGPSYLLKEAIRESIQLKDTHPKLEVAKARLKILEGQITQGTNDLEALAIEKGASREAVLAYAEILVADGKIAQARLHLRRLMTSSTSHPRVLSLLAESYLKSGPFYNTDYAIQLATNACQATNWVSPREMHILAEAFYHAGDRIAALLVASKAKEAGRRLLAYREFNDLEKLIQNLSVGTQA